jgi:signal transduction histidine kinase
VKTLTYVPPVVITGINRFNEPVNLSTSPELLREMTFKHQENVFTIEYAALSYDMSEYNQYAYKLEGFDKDWVYCGNRQEATYTNLEPGTYTFRVKGSNNDGIWNENGTSIAVTITPPFWKTWWFRVSGFLAILLSVGGTIRYVEMKRLNRKIEQLEMERALERERTRISQDMHDEVGSSLSEISILSELAKRDLRKPEEAVARIQEISDRSGEVIGNIGEIIWAINPKNDPVENFVSYLRRYSTHYLGLANIRCTFSVADDIPDFTFSSVIRRNVFLVAKEALHNVVKHSAASEAKINIGFTGKAMEIRIEDNGKGFVPEEKYGSGNGLTSMKQRLDDIGARFTLESRPGCGAKVLIGIGV